MTLAEASLVDNAPRGTDHLHLQVQARSSTQGINSPSATTCSTISLVMRVDKISTFIFSSILLLSFITEKKEKKKERKTTPLAIYILSKAEIIIITMSYLLFIYSSNALITNLATIHRKLMTKKLLMKTKENHPEEADKSERL